MIKRSVKSIDSIRPLTVFIIYISLIPIFSLIYVILPGQNYYAPYARMEPSAQKDISEISDIFSNKMITSYKKFSKNGWRIPENYVNIGDLSIDYKRNVSFNGYFHAQLYDGDAIYAFSGGPQVSVTMSSKRIITKYGNENIYCHFITRSPVGDPGDKFTFPLKTLFSGSENFEKVETICLNEKEEKKLLDVQNGWNGDPMSLRGFFLRMMYFSAITITSVGYGDIIPITDMARFFVAIEAIFGWVIAGLFINSVATKFNKSS